MRKFLRGLCATCVTCRDEIPVDELHHGGEVVSAFVLVFEVVGVLPDVDPEEWFCAGHDGRVLVGGRFNDEFGVADGEPDPTAAEDFEARCDQLFLERLLVFEMGFDVFEQGACGGGSPFFQALPEERVVCVAAAVIPEIVSDILRLCVELG